MVSITSHWGNKLHAQRAIQLEKNLAWFYFFFFFWFGIPTPWTETIQMDFGSAYLWMVSITSHCAVNAFQILNLTKETKRLLPLVILSVTVPHTLSLPDQVSKSTFLWYANFKLKKSHFLINLHLISTGQAGRAIRTGRCWHHPNRRRKMFYSIKGWCPWINREGNTTHL